MARNHGTRARYTNDGCRCAACSIASSEYERKGGKRRDPYLLPGFDADPKWMREGACRTANLPTTAYFPPQHQPRALERPIKVCQGCPVVDDCLQFALRHRLHGVWGATSERQRRRMKARAA